MAVQEAVADERDWYSFFTSRDYPRCTNFQGREPVPYTFIPSSISSIPSRFQGAEYHEFWLREVWSFNTAVDIFQVDGFDSPHTGARTFNEERYVVSSDGKISRKYKREYMVCGSNSGDARTLTSKETTWYDFKSPASGEVRHLRECRDSRGDGFSRTNFAYINQPRYLIQEPQWCDN